MKKAYIAGLSVLSASLLLGGCAKRQPSQASVPQAENPAAKRMMQGIWLDEENESVVFRVKGDTIYYPDTTSVPAYFKIIQDTLVLGGEEQVKYPIARQSERLFHFYNQSGELVRLQKSENASDIDFFEQRPPVVLNQGHLIKRDTVVMYGGERYHCYVQINPTTYKVRKATYTSEGVVVDNIYYDNIIHLSVFHGASKVYSSNFVKTDFRKHIPVEVLRQCILSEMTFHRIDQDGVHYIAMLGIPDSPGSYTVGIVISYHGQLYMRTLE